MKILAGIFGAIGVIAVVIGLGWIVQGNSFFMFQVFAPKYEAVRRDTMIQSRAYSEATTREMYRLKLQYQQAKGDDEKATIRAMTLHEAEAFDRNRLPPDLQSFLIQLGE